MATVTDRELLDMATTTLNELRREKVTQFAQRLTHYEVMGRIFKRDKTVIGSGQGVQQRVMVDHSGAAKQVGMTDLDNLNITDVMQFVDVPWRHTTTNFSWNRIEMLENRSPARIVDLLRTRRIDGMLSLAEQMETQFWSAPSASTNELDVFGVPYWVVKPGANEEGFDGGNPSGFSGGAGGLDSDVFTRWVNYVADYATINKTDLLVKWRKAFRLTDFRSPLGSLDFRNGRGQRFRNYCNLDTITELETIGENQNENLGRDIASMDGMITFRQTAIVWVAELDSDSTNPIYGLDFDWFFPVVLSGNAMHESDPTAATNMHNWMVVYVDLSWNVMCTDRRRQYCLAAI